MKNAMRTKDITTMALLATILAILGTFKLPGIVPGTEFQLSAPFAVCIAACFGFKKYFKIGILASLINYMLGTHTIINITVAMVFRVVAGGFISLIGTNPITLLVGGPLGTAAGRLVLAPIMGVSPLPLLLAALPGRFYTAAGAMLLYPLMKRLTVRFYGELPAGKGILANWGKGSLNNDNESTAL